MVVKRCAVGCRCRYGSGLRSQTVSVSHSTTCCMPNSADRSLAQPHMNFTLRLKHAHQCDKAAQGESKSDGRGMVSDIPANRRNTISGLCTPISKNLARSCRKSAASSIRLSSAAKYGKPYS